MRIAAACVLFCVASGVSSMEATGSMKYKGGMTYEAEAGRKLYVSGDNNVKYEETVTEKNNEDGSKYMVYNSELKSKKGNHTNFIRVTEQEVNVNDDPSARKIIRTVVLNNFDPTNPDKNSTRTIQYEYSPEESFLADRGAAAMTNNGRPLVVKVTDRPSETHSTQSGLGTNQPDPANFNQYPKPEDYQRECPSYRPIGGASGTYPSQYRPGPYQPDPASSNQFSKPEDYNRERASSQPIGGASGTYPSQSRPGNYQPNPANIDQIPKPEDYNRERASSQPTGGASGTYPSQYRPGPYQPDPASFNQFSKPEDYNRERASSQPIGGASETYPSQSRPGPYQSDPTSFSQYPYKSEAYDKPRGYYSRR